MSREKEIQSFTDWITKLQNSLLDEPDRVIYYGDEMNPIVYIIDEHENFIDTDKTLDELIRERIEDISNPSKLKVKEMMLNLFNKEKWLKGEI